ncbi:MAG: hypothetical protein JWP97_6736 [Labilithrix sp.]|nr:hypothetical protein [Labilithrix sp.]
MSNGGGAFRDASAALERMAMLEQENEGLRTELAELAQLRIQVEEIDTLRAEVAALREAQRSPNEGAFLRRLQEERVELTDEVRTLRLRLAEQEGALVKLRREVKRAEISGLATALTTVVSRVLKGR